MCLSFEMPVLPEHVYYTCNDVPVHNYLQVTGSGSSTSVLQVSFLTLCATDWQFISADLDYSLPRVGSGAL